MRGTATSASQQKIHCCITSTLTSGWMGEGQYTVASWEGILLNPLEGPLVLVCVILRALAMNDTSVDLL